MLFTMVALACAAEQQANGEEQNEQLGAGNEGLQSIDSVEASRYVPLSMAQCALKLLTDQRSTPETLLQCSIGHLVIMFLSYIENERGRATVGRLAACLFALLCLSLELQSHHLAYYSFNLISTYSTFLHLNQHYGYGWEPFINFAFIFESITRTHLFADEAPWLILASMLYFRVLQ